MRGELSGTRIDALVYRTHLQLPALAPHRVLVGSEQFCNTPVGKTAALEFAQGRRIQVFQALLPQRLLLRDQVSELRQKPRINAGQLINLSQSHADAHGVSNIPDTVRAGVAQLDFDIVALGSFFVEAIITGFQTA